MSEHPHDEQAERDTAAQDEMQPQDEARAQRQPQISDVHANPQDTVFGREAAADLERVDRGERPVHDGEPEPEAWGKAT